MTTHVSTTEYRAELRQWHERVRSGEEIVVTDNGEPVVRVVPAVGDTLLERMEREGMLRPARRRRPVSAIDTVPAPGDTAEAISLDRDR